MAPTSAASEVMAQPRSPSSSAGNALAKTGGYGAGGVVQAADGDSNQAFHSDALPRMTPELLMEICKERQMWTQPHLNTQLYLNYKGFLRMEGMEEYVNVKSLMLDNNCISRIEGLDRMSALKSLHLGGNRIIEISGLESNLELRQINLEGNAIAQVGNIRHLVNLETLNLSVNRIENLEDLAELKELPKLINIDVSHNSIEATEGVPEFWAEFQGLKVLRYHGNPGVRHVSHYRKRIINALPQLTYMDERPVFAVERKSCTAWAAGGMEAMHEAKREHHKERHAQCSLDPERREFLTRSRDMAIARLNREAKEREEKEEVARREADAKKAVVKPKVEDGSDEAMKEYEKGWAQKVSLYGVDGVREKISKEMGGSAAKSMAGDGNQQSLMPAPASQEVPREESKTLDVLQMMAGEAPTQREYKADFDFSPPARGSELVSSSGSTATSSSAGRRQNRTAPDAADFRVRSTGAERDHCDTQFAAYGDDMTEASLYKPLSASGASGDTRSGGYSSTQQPAAANAPVMPLIWEQKQAENARAEAECMAMQNKYSFDTSDAASFRNHDLGGLD